MQDARAGVSTLDLTGPAALRPFVVRGLVDAGRTVLVVAATVREAEDLTEELQDVLDPDSVAFYPAWETLPHERLSPRSDTVGRRLAVLRRIKHPGTRGQQRPAQGGGRADPLGAPATGQGTGRPRAGRAGLGPGGRARGRLRDGWSGAAYSRVDLVEKRGEFAVRGGIVDVFPPTEEHPLRVEFFGDEIDEIRSFAVADQRTNHGQGRAPVGAAVPRAAAHRRRTPQGGRARPGAPAARARSPTSSPRAWPSRGWSRWLPCSSTRWRCSSSCSRRTPTCSCSTPSGSAREPTTWSRPARSSSARAGRPPRPVAGSDRPRGRIAARHRRGAHPGARARPGLVGGQPVRAGPAARRRQSREVAGAAGAGVPRRHRAGRRRHRRPPRARASGWSRCTRVTARRSAWSRCWASTTSPPGWSRTVFEAPLTLAPQPPRARQRRAGHPGLPRARLRPRGPRPGDPHRRGHRRAEGHHARHAQDAGAAQEADRPARAQGRRLRRPRAARRRPVRGDEAARGARRGARVPRPGVRLLQARPPARPPLRAGRRARPGDPLRRWRVSPASTASAAPTGPSARAAPARRCARSRPS